MHDNDRPLLGLQLLQRRIEQVAVGNGGSDVTAGQAVDREKFHLHRTTSATADRVDARAEYEAMKPRLEAIGIAQRGKTTPCGKEPFLDRVSRELVVAEDQAGSSAAKAS